MRAIDRRGLLVASRHAPEPEVCKSPRPNGTRWNHLVIVPPTCFRATYARCCLYKEYYDQSYASIDQRHLIIYGHRHLLQSCTMDSDTQAMNGATGSSHHQTLKLGVSRTVTVVNRCDQCTPQPVDTQGTTLGHACVSPSCGLDLDCMPCELMQVVPDQRTWLYN